ncbi:lrgB-like family domain-containing protein [Purpureocillium lilacinum]|uniref:LrgB-like family domain-containing protein n=1 Tax=Purpureocillium lilacinum TaxID=33203 RepID=A0A179HGB5_PURLI|nr:lrgB-like family domain-containing protein [Purpureocillium lilacinum]OAQ89446.1 lrgB-like family domain-containing protein [Purpureocillium lilacinum]
MGIWRERWRETARFVGTIFWLGVIYLTSELIVWGFSRLLAPSHLEFYASILAMLSAFVVMTGASYLFADVDIVYQQHIMPKMDLINANLGIGFSIPICLTKHSDILSSHDIVRVFGAFVITNVASWIGVLLTSASMVWVVNELTDAIAPVFGRRRRRTAALKHGGLKEVLETLSSGTPLYALLTSRITRKRLPKYARWISQVTNKRLPKNRKDWFGAGDLALSLLECGLFTWGFKLYECRRQLFSTKGFTVTVVCVGAAAANVFLSVFIAHSLALAAPESLAFSTRSTTLALSKPAITAVGGNVAVNAMIVVSNGILGQLMFPFVLDRLGVQRHPPNSNTREMAVELQPVSRWSGSTEGETSGTAGEDNVMTVAAGVTSGINSAAMGVSYMYETNSRAAPYTALSMVVFGVVTVVLTTVEPFKAMVTGIAKG